MLPCTIIYLPILCTKALALQLSRSMNLHRHNASQTYVLLCNFNTCSKCILSNADRNWTFVDEHYCSLCAWTIYTNWWPKQSTEMSQKCSHCTHQVSICAHSAHALHLKFMAIASTLYILAQNQLNWVKHDNTSTICTFKILQYDILCYDWHTHIYTRCKRALIRLKWHKRNSYTTHTSAWCLHHWVLH